ncbi:DUF6994 family protein [Tessaracoccus rhinocerotis]|uniref:DUF6994 family protein n=1 Tax=Tessaracoccus rhinocerotis TaxID=1689449 RepID=UPI003CCC7D79
MESPLANRLNYYSDFFELFGDFDTYLRFFLLDDLVTADRASVRSFLDGEAVTSFPAPAFVVTPSEYTAYRVNSMRFVQARNDRIRRLRLSSRPSSSAQTH